MKNKPSALAKRICRRYFDVKNNMTLWEIIDREVARENELLFKKDKNGKILVVKDGVVVGAQG